MLIEKMEYKTTIKTLPFLFLEMKKTANLVLQRLAEVEIRKKAIDENIFQVNTEKRRKEIVAMVLRRINVLDEVLLHKLVFGDVETGKLIVLYAMMKTDRLFFEFMNEVFKEKLIVKEDAIEDKDFNLFFYRKKEQSEKVASWDDYTLYKLKQVFIRILYEAGLINNRRERKIIMPFLDRSLIDHLRSKGEESMLKILLGLN